VYNVSNATTVYPGVRFTGRTACDVTGLMTATETIAAKGNGKNGLSRYGDYNGIVTDPVDGSFWLTGQYNPTGDWSTRIVHFSITPCVATQVNTSATTVSIFEVTPVPATDNLQITKSSEVAEAGELQLVDMSGKVVLTKKLQLAKGTNEAEFDVKKVSEGSYVLRLNSESGSVFKKVVIQR